MKSDRKQLVTAILVLVCVAVVSIATTISFVGMWTPDVIVEGPGVTQVKRLSDYFPSLKGSRGDTNVYFLEGKEPGGTVCVMGGTHADEAAGWMGAILLIENAVVKKGRLIVIPQCDLSAFTHSYPQEAYPQHIHIATRSGVRSFRFGSRTANSIDFWPDPEVYVHFPSGQHLSGDEVRNLNRAYPGRPNGSFTERIAYAIRQIIVKEHVALNVDLHEAPPEYPFINALGAGARGQDIATVAAMDLQAQGIPIGLELSPSRFHGLTYRELGDFTPTISLLMETANPSQGRLRGITDGELVLKGQDAFYVQAARLKRTFVPFNENGWPLEMRVGRHLSALKEIWSVFSEDNPDKAVVIEGFPTLSELKEKGVGSFLNPVTRAAGQSAEP
jgi:hypothetical protein